MTTTLVLLGLAAPIVALLVGAALKVDDWSRDLSTNTAATASDHPDERLRPLVTDRSRESVDAALARFVTSHKAWTEADGKPLPEDSPLRQQTKGPTEVRHLVHGTTLFGFKDDVWIVVENAEDGQLRLHGDSRSRIGKGDLGQNPRNLREVLGALRRELVTR